MNLLINDKEIVKFLVDIYSKNVKFYSFPEFSWPQTTYNADRLKISYNKNKSKPSFNKKEEVIKVKAKMLRFIQADLKSQCELVKEIIDARRQHFFNLFHRHIDYIFRKLGEEKIFEAYKKHKSKNFIKTVGYYINPNAQFVRRSKTTDYDSDCLMRNTVSNESMLLDKISNNKPFWFIDSGYTNFLESNKKWHRLVRNHIHSSGNFLPPVDRLGIFKSFPTRWRRSGHTILIIEPGKFSASIFKVDIKKWKYSVEEELRQYTDKKIIFREKAPKKSRKSLYHELKNEDYYCLVNINSNAATEAIWNGIPVITLDRHITNSVSRQHLRDINNLLRPNLAHWLAMLSYSQFTYDELMNGLAVKLLKKINA